ncbi:NADH-quinone oxidoreductase subunit J family protein [Sporolituus thermophilus]|uniref:NADH-quinone oxidoreductase subunit J n=1 Tax=Sporolituus thermophilus DSM 23256 TaxID=1123285 RepID=A0A1G7HM40_9FIRM|nr:NADH-quinone oxidoreductase subunit J [Sporolituus thermophilus]SDF01386.1 NADH dehydrogenase subunit J [Sporolituus thermophilus DSM 23256]
MDKLVYTAAFYVLTALTLAAAAGVVFKRNLVHSALLLALTFIGVAGLYVLLQADFLAAVQVLVYNGAVAVIVVIGVMVTQRGDMKSSNPSNSLGWKAAAVTAIFTGMIVAAIAATPWQLAAAPPSAATAPAIAEILLRDFAVAFETAAVLLLVAMMGAIILAKGVDKT